MARGEIVLRVRMDPAVQLYTVRAPVPDPAGDWVRVQDLPMEVENTPSQEAARQAAVDGPLRRAIESLLNGNAIDRELYMTDPTYHAVAKVIGRRG